MLRTKTNDELFSLYKTELTLRIRNQRNLSRYHQVLDQFQNFLSDNNPSALLAKSFLSKWGKQKPATLYKYMSIIKGFLNWYGEELDLKVKLPHQMPEYVEDESIKKLIATIKNKQTHKKAIEQDILLVQLAYNSGLRREELANLKVCDILINEKALIVRKGKGMKDRTVPLPSGIVRLLQAHIVDMNPDDSVFNIKPVAISDKIRRIAKNAGVKIHAHSLRHGYATRLLEKGANIKAVQELLGHSRIGTTEAYLSLLPKHLRETVDLLDAETDTNCETPLANQKELEKHLDELAETAGVLAHHAQRFILYKDDDDIEAMGNVLGHLMFWRKSNGTIVEEGTDPVGEVTYETENPVDPHVASWLYTHYDHRFGKLPFEEWNQLSTQNVSGEILDNLKLLAHGSLKSCPNCPVCKEIID